MRLGYEFNLACRAFNAISVDTSDLGPVPDLLRTILEDTLSQEASPQSLDRYLPRIRDIIINLLHGLKKKQARLRSRQQKDDGRAIPGRQASAPSPVSAPVGGSGHGHDYAPSSPTKRPWARRYGSSVSADDNPVMPRSSSTSAVNTIPERGSSRYDSPAHTYYQSDLSSMRSMPTSTDSSPYASVAPPPPPKQDDAIGALQRSGELERRASRRFSAYQIQKHLGPSSSGVHVLPPPQHSPVPNRGLDVRESLNAVRLRNHPYPHGRQRSTNRPYEPAQSKSTQPRVPPSIPSEEERTHNESRIGPPTGDPATSDSTSTIIQEKKIRRPSDERRELSTAGQRPEAPALAESPELSKDSSVAVTPEPSPPAAVSTPPRASPSVSEQPSPAKELTIFLQYKSQLKKYIIPEGSSGVTLGRLQLAFIEKFAWNTHHNGVDLPEIYVQDPVSGVRYELEDMNDVKDRAVLVLNVDTLDEVRRHVDEGFGGVRTLIEGVKGSLQSQESIMHHVSERQSDSAKELARLAAAPPRAAPARAPETTGSVQKTSMPSVNSSQVAELQSLRRDLAVLRQTYSSFTSEIGTSMSAVRTKANGVKGLAKDMSVPTYQGDAGRARVNSGKKELADESEQLVVRVDDLQDLVEELRKDVVSRGVRPLPKQLDTVSKNIQDAFKQIKKMQDFLKHEKPIWTKIWESELQLVCEERDQLTMQEDLAADLDDDMDKAAQTFALVEQATRQQETQVSNGVVLRSTSRNLIFEPALDPVKAKDDMLGEVRALQPNHESRLEAIERAEKARKKDLENREVDRFQKELGTFVQEGKLKKSGGVEETERLRRAKDERARKEVWENQQFIAAEREKARREKAERQRAEAEREKEERGQEGEEATAEDEQENKDKESEKNEGSGYHTSSEGDTNMRESEQHYDESGNGNDQGIASGSGM